MTSDITIAILAAGSSSRMGSPKQLLNWGEEKLLNHSIKTASSSNASKVIVVLGANYKLIENEIKDYQVTILNNKDWQKGLGKSIACAAKYVLKSNSKAQGLLVVLADQPLINTSFLNTLIQNFSFNERQIIATFYDKGKKGVPVLFDRSYLEELSNLKDDTGAKQLLENHEFFVKALKPPLKNVDLDTKEDYLNLLKSNFKSK